MIRLFFLLMILGKSSLFAVTTPSLDKQTQVTKAGKRLDGKVALVTGAAQGIGKETAIFLAREGAQVIISDVNDRDGQLVAQEIGSSAIYIHLDVSSDHDWKTAMTAIMSQFSRLDILVNNAGISGLQAGGALDPENGSLKKWREIQAINFEGVFLGCKYGIQIMKTACEGGSIINIASAAGLVGFPGNPMYAATKAAVINYTKSVALYCCQERYNIRCNSILPTFILTPMLSESSCNSREYKNKLEEFIKTIPMCRLGMPEDVANAVVFLASNESKYITGLELVIDGGIMSWSGIPLKR